MQSGDNILSTALQENVPGALTSAVPEPKNLNAEVVTNMAAGFLKRLGHKSGVKPKRVSLEETTYTVEFEMKKFTATVRIDANTREIKEYDLAPKGEESSILSISPRNLLTVAMISAMVSLGLYFGLKIIGL
jgi:hypothetical protein